MLEIKYKFRIPTKKTSRIHVAPENTAVLLLDQPSREASTTCTRITRRYDITINANTTN